MENLDFDKFKKSQDELEKVLKEDNNIVTDEDKKKLLNLLEKEKESINDLIDFLNNNLK